MWRAALRRVLVWVVTLAVLGVVIYEISTPHSKRPCLQVRPTDCGGVRK